MKNFLHISISQAEATSREDLQDAKELNEQELALVVGGSKVHEFKHEHDPHHDQNDLHHRGWHHNNWHHHHKQEHHGHK
jgi:bacteriocin-like protein